MASCDFMLGILRTFINGRKAGPLETEPVDIVNVRITNKDNYTIKAAISYSGNTDHRLNIGDVGSTYSRKVESHNLEKAMRSIFDFLDCESIYCDISAGRRFRSARNKSGVWDIKLAHTKSYAILGESSFKEYGYILTMADR